MNKKIVGTVTLEEALEHFASMSAENRILLEKCEPDPIHRFGMISIRPTPARLILNGEKDLEIRSTCPKEWKDYLEGKTSKKPEPTVWFIYVTQAKPKVAPFHFEEGWIYQEYNSETHYACGCTANMGEDINGKVVGCFVLENVEEFGSKYAYSFKDDHFYEILKRARLTSDTLAKYVKCTRDDWEKGKCKAYAWEIAKGSLEIFDKPKKLSDFRANEKTRYPLCKAPQSWRYVEL